MANKTNTVINGNQARFRIQYRVPGEYRIDKKGFAVPVYKNFYGSSKTAAEKKRDEWIRFHSQKNEQTFNDEMDYFLKNVFATDPSIKESTKRLYARSWRANFRTQQFLYRGVPEVTAKELQTELDSLPCAVSTKKAICKLLKRFYAYQSIENGVPDRTRFLHVLDKAPVRKKDIVVWRKEELDKILAAMESHRLRFLVWLAFHTGARISELLALQYDDFKDGYISIDKQVVHREKDAENGSKGLALDIGKVKSADSVRSIPVSDETMREFARHKEWHQEEMMRIGYRTEYVFTTNSGRLLERRNVYRSLERVYVAAEVEHRKFHAYRATFASNLAANNTPAQVLKELLGHSGIGVTTKYYVKVAEEQKREAIEILDSDNLAIF